MPPCNILSIYAYNPKEISCMSGLEIKRKKTNKDKQKSEWLQIFFSTPCVRVGEHPHMIT